MPATITLDIDPTNGDLILFPAMTDLGIVQNPISGDPADWAVVLPGRGTNQIMVEGSFSPSFQAGAELHLPLVWVAALAAAVPLLLRGAVGQSA